MRNKKYLIGVDVGGTKINAVLYEGRKVLDSYQLATPKEDLKAFIIMLKATIEPLLEKAKALEATVEKIGIGLPGRLSPTNDSILENSAPNLPILVNAKIADLLREQLATDIPIKLDNDAACFVRGESLHGAGRKSKNVFGLVIGTGVGGAWWLGSKVYAGHHNGAGEPGAMLVDLDKRITLEEAYHKLTQRNPEALAQEAQAGDKLAEESFKELGNYFGLAMANIVNLIDPEIIVVGGGVAASSELFLENAREAMLAQLVSSEAAKVKIVKSKLGQNAGAIGAALIS